MGMGKEQLTVAEFSRLTGVPDHTLRRLDESGLLVAVRTEGGHRRYSAEQADEALQFVKAMKLLAGGRNVVRQMKDLEPFFAYLLGLIFADGTVLESGQVQLEMKDEQIMRDVASILGCDVHPRSDRPMFRMTVPRLVANRLVEYGVCRKKSKGFDIPDMSEVSFGPFLHGLFDGDGSVSQRDGQIIVRFHGHPRPMAQVQATLLQQFGFYMPWVQDNRMDSGMLETGRRSVVVGVQEIMYRTPTASLKRKQEKFI